MNNKSSAPLTGQQLFTLATFAGQLTSRDSATFVRRITAWAKMRAEQGAVSDDDLMQMMRAVLLSGRFRRKPARPAPKPARPAQPIRIPYAGAPKRRP